MLFPIWRARNVAIDQTTYLEQVCGELPDEVLGVLSMIPLGNSTWSSPRFEDQSPLEPCSRTGSAHLELPVHHRTNSHGMYRFMNKEIRYTPPPCSARQFHLSFRTSSLVVYVAQEPSAPAFCVLVHESDCCIRSCGSNNFKEIFGSVYD